MKSPASTPCWRPALPARSRTVPRRGEEGALRLHREAQPEEPAPPTRRPVLAEGEREVLRPYRRTRTPGNRVVQTLTITDLGVGFPLAVQVAKIVRHRTQRTTGKHSRETVYVITDLTSREAPQAHREDRPLTVDHREPAPLRPRLHLRSGRLHGPHRTPPRQQGHPPQLRHQHTASRRPRTSRSASARCPTTASADHWTSSNYPDQHSRRIKRPCNSPGGRLTWRHGARALLDSRTWSVARADVILLTALSPPPSALRPPQPVRVRPSVNNPRAGEGIE